MDFWYRLSQIENRLYRLLNTKPWTRMFYWFFQLMIWEHVWVVEYTRVWFDTSDTTLHREPATYWVFAQTPEFAAYYASQQTDIPDGAVVQVRRPLSRKRTTLMCEFSGHEYTMALEV